MAKNGFLAFVLDQLGGIDDVVARSMFGGVGLYAGSVFFAIIHRDIVYFKVDDKTRPSFVRAGMKPFKPFADRPTTMQYYEVPANVLEDAEELTKWAQRAIAVAKRKPAARNVKP
jgi:DNA transformation protein